MHRALRITTAAIASLATGFALALLLALAGPIEPLLPEGEAVACFTSRDDLGMALSFGRPGMPDAGPAIVDRLRLKLTRYGEEEPDAEHPSKRWHYSFATTLTIREHGTWSDGGQCDWTDDRLSHYQFDLGCYQDCDGGSISLYRLPFTRSLVLGWDFLAMQPRGAVTNRSWLPALFKLDPAPASACAVKAL